MKYIFSITAPTDYTSVNEVLVFPDGSVPGVEVCVDISIINNIVQETSEDFFVRIISSDAEISLAVATITILNNGEGQAI